MNWLQAIKDYLAVNVEIAPADLMKDQPFTAWGGVIAARKVVRDGFEWVAGRIE